MARTGGPDEGRGGRQETDPEARLSDVLQPLTRPLVVDVLEAMDYPYFVDRDGDIGLLWSQVVFHVYLLGQEHNVLQVRGAWHRRLTIERLREVLELLDARNRRFGAPKCYVRVLDDGRLAIVAETSVPLPGGVSRAQLRSILASAVGLGWSLMRDLDATYPDPVARAPGEPT